MEGVEVNIYGPLSLIANAHNERHMYAFYAVKSDLLKKNSEANWGWPPLNPPLLKLVTQCHSARSHSISITIHTDNYLTIRRSDNLTDANCFQDVHPFAKTLSTDALLIAWTYADIIRGCRTVA